MKIPRNTKTPIDMIAGTVHKTNSNESFEVVEYLGCLKVDIKFAGFSGIVRTTAAQIRTGELKNPNKPSVFGFGFIGIGKHKSTSNGAVNKAYRKWVSMIERCYCPKYRVTHPTYQGVEVCDEWKNFQVFAEWFSCNSVDGYHLDKDIKIKGSKIYSPETCLFVPACVNSLMTDHRAKRGACKIGVHVQNGKFVATVKKGGKSVYLGTFDCEIEAHSAYLTEKNNQIDAKIKMYPYLSEYLINHKTNAQV